jgi:1-deoxy-D-xylulose-5-phosphate synthase
MAGLRARLRTPSCACQCRSGRRQWSRRLRKSVLHFAQPGQLFGSGITYVGPVPGHDLPRLHGVLRRALRDLEGPVLVHVRTQKGRGYEPAVADQVSFHGAALPPMTVIQGGANGTNAAVSAAAQAEGDATPSVEQVKAAKSKPPNYTTVMANELIELGKADPRIVAITAGMPTGTGLSRFQAVFPDRMFDVGIAEQHALTMATGLALGGMRPFVGIYSTFLQRAFDQTSTTSARTTQRWSSVSTAPASSARTARATRACSRSPPSASCPT